MKDRRDDYDICKCGDYRLSHVAGTGACLLNELGHGGAPHCTKFSLSTKASADADRPKAVTS
jgi:hypothetical protein